MDCRVSDFSIFVFWIGIICLRMCSDDSCSEHRAIVGKAIKLGTLVKLTVIETHFLDCFIISDVFLLHNLGTIAHEVG